MTDVHHCINCIFSFSKILYKIFIANILCEILFHCKYYCSLPLLESKYIEIIHVGLISSKVNHFSAFKILKTYCIEKTLNLWIIHSNPVYCLVYRIKDWHLQIPLNDRGKLCWYWQCVEFYLHNKWEVLSGFCFVNLCNHGFHIIAVNTYYFLESVKSIVL